jgi:Sec-independent protein secretion pathway component TatC
MKFNTAYIWTMSILTILLIYCFITAPIKWDITKIILAISLCSMGTLTVFITIFINKPKK